MGSFRTTPSPSPQVTEESDQEIEALLLSLPKGKGWLAGGLFLYQGCWPKSGTTWLKALIFSIVNRSRYTNATSPLLTTNPHELVPFIEFTLYGEKELPDLTSIQSPRLFSTHIPYMSLPVSIKECNNTRIVYICRNPFDVVVSSWHFAARARNSLERSMEDLVDNFCKGIEAFGSFWDHVLGYWKESLENPHKVLFLKYEDLKEDTNFHLKRLAEFIGFPFSMEEEKEGVIEEISKLFSLSSLKDLEVNKTGKFMPNFENKCYFRNGEVGDWVNHLTPSMVERLEKVIEEKLEGSGLSFQASTGLISSSSLDPNMPHIQNK
ncbi:Sulfotransferase 2A, putative [Theobroma cacao]|uniref:Sulfotransferase n=1 Tax=Theobroma cacao TaxID=3641 RepID=A0A061FXU8_THECC|nr:Sulfotransferase 2A, putative [Theobroma cacao]